MKQIQHWINGRYVAGNSARNSDVFNPSTGEVQASVPLANASEVQTAVDKAKAAYKNWSMTPPLRRARIMFKFRDLIFVHCDFKSHNLIEQI